MTVNSDDVTYLGDGKVQIVTVVSGDEDVSAKTLPFGEWADIEARRAGSYAVGDALADRIDDDDVDLSGLRGPSYAPLRTVVGTPDDGSSGHGVLVEYVYTDEDGTTVAEPTIGFDRVVELAPREVTVDVELDGHVHESVVPVWVTGAEALDMEPAAARAG